MIISDLEALLVHFDVDGLPNPRWFQQVNRRIYKNTECGASISVYGTLPFDSVSPEEQERFYNLAKLQAVAQEYEDHFDELVAIYGQLKDQDSEAAFRMADAEAAFLSGEPTDFIAIVREHRPDLFKPVDVPRPETVPAVFHNGHNGDIPESFVLTGFTIQTIVEGSEATVDNDLFELPVESEHIDAWIEDMEAQADDLWHEANDDYDEE